MMLHIRAVHIIYQEPMAAIIHLDVLDIAQEYLVILKLLSNCMCTHTCTLPRMWTSRRLRGQPPEGQKRREVGSADSWLCQGKSV